jgi:ABC-type dipeptide/oligopeptide/nickel transport system permease subunit
MQTTFGDNFTVTDGNMIGYGAGGPSTAGNSPIVDYGCVNCLDNGCVNCLDNGCGNSSAGGYDTGNSPANDCGHCSGNNRGTWAQVMKRLIKNKPAVVGLCGILAVVMAALFAPYITGYGYDQQLIWTEGKDAQLKPPSAKHWFGTDYYGRDVFTRVVYGARVSLMTAVVSTVIAMFIGTLMGALAGYYGGIVDDLISWAINVIFAFPFLLFVLALVAYLPSGPGPVYAAIGMVNWAPIARIVRGQVLSARERDFVQAAMLLGFGDLRIIWSHIMPNVLAPVVVQSTLGMGNIIMLEASLSFLGFGVQPPTPSWGYMIDQGRHFLMSGHWWWSVFPGLAIMLLVLSFNLLGDGLRDALDPRLSRNQ